MTLAKGQWATSNNRSVVPAEGLASGPIGERAMEKYRGWDQGRRAMLALPGWLCVLLIPYFAWLDVIVPRPRLVLVASLAAFGLIATLKCSVGIPNGDEELGWSGVGLLAVGLLWAPFLAITAAYPFYLMGAAVLWLSYTTQKWRGRGDGVGAESTHTSDEGPGEPSVRKL